MADKLQIPSSDRIANYWEIHGGQPPSDFDPNDPSQVNADWVMNMMDKIVNGEYATRSFKVYTTYASLPISAVKGQTAYVTESGYENSFFIYDGTTWVQITANGGGSSTNLIFNNITASVWVTNDDVATMDTYSYKCELICADVTASMFATVVFNLADSQSGNYANVCDTGSGTVTIYGNSTNTLLIPTIVALS
jgi:hypothetical protein